MIAGIDYSTRFVDVVLLDEDTDAATWHRFPLHGADAFDRARSVRVMFSSLTEGWPDWDAVMAVGIEDPRGYNAGAIYRIQGAILACLPRSLLVQPFPPSVWRKTVGLPGNASKGTVRDWVNDRRYPLWKKNPLDGLIWGHDACDAYCVALATRTLLQVAAA